MKTNKLLLSTAAFGFALTFAGTTNVFADEQNSETHQEKSTLQTLEEEVASLKNNQSSIKIRLTNIAEKKAAKAQTLTVQSQLDASEVKLEKAEQALQAEKNRIAEAEQKAEEARKVEQAKAEAERARKEAIETGKPVASNIVPSYTPHANSYPWGQCTWGVKVLAPWVGDYWGNAAQWAASAAAAGFRTGTAPVAGSVIVWNDGGYGHVAVVTAVQSATSIQVSEANYAGNQAIGNYRGWFNPAAAGQGSFTYIYPN